jgi:hypothetical protein
MTCGDAFDDECDHLRLDVRGNTLYTCDTCRDHMEKQGLVRYDETQEDWAVGNELQLSWVNCKTGMAKFSLLFGH